MKAKTFTLLALFIVFQSQAQSELYVDTTITAEQMVMDFFDGACVEISNVLYTGVSQSKGYFEGANTDIGIPAGMLLTSGLATNAIGPSVSNGISANVGQPGDPDLSAAINGIPTNDASVLEFDFISDVSDTMTFSYAFASEEYNEWVNSTFNDVFAFYVQGPGYDSMTNIALLPDGQTIVSINNVNLGLNPMYYVDYVENGGYHLEYDGVTIELSAPFVVQANETYHIKIAVADAGDSALDSGVFLGIESLCGDSLLVPPAETSFSMIGSTIYLTNESRYATSYFWDFGDGTTSTERYPAPHTYMQDGYFTISLTTQNYCCSDTWTALVPVGNVLDIDVYACETNAFQLDAVAPGVGEEGQWSVLIGEGDVIDIENPNSILNNPSIGINMLEWRITEQSNGNLVLADTFVLNVNENPEVSIITDISDFCENDPSIVIETFPSGGEFTGPFTGDIFDPALVGIGVHTIIYTYTDTNGCSGETVEVTTVYEAPDIEISLTAEAFCVLDSPILLEATPAGGIFEGPGVSVDVFNPAIAGVGIHEISYQYTNPEGCFDTESTEIEVFPLPSVSIIDLVALCENVEPVQLTGMPAGGVFDGPGISDDIFDPAQAGTGIHVISYTYTDLNGCSNTASQDIEIIPAPSTPEIILIGSDSLFANVTGLSYFWQLNGALLNVDGQQIQIQGDGNYTVFVISQLGCVSEVSDVFSFTGINDFFSSTNPSLEVYPNPAGDFVQVSIMVEKLERLLEVLKIYNNQGQVIRSVSNETNQNSLNINIRDLAPGIYFILARNGDLYYSGSFIKK